MKTQEQREKDLKIKEAYKNIRYKTAFIESLANYLGKNKNAVKQHYFFDKQGVSIKLQDIVLEKIILQLKYDKIYDKIIEKKVWGLK